MRNRISVRPWMPIVTAIAALLSITLLLPGILVKRISGGSSDVAAPSVALREETKPVLIPVYRTREERVDRVPLETYVRNVLAAEMPAEFELEALKAQAIAARTYIVKRWMDGDTSQVPVQGALVTDTVAHQAYVTEEQMKRNWPGDEFAKRLDKLNRAVNETAGLIVTYQHKPIQAAFFSTSNGYTENSEDYWRDYIPYLRSVPSPWDKELSPKFTATTTMSVQEFAKRLGIGAIPASAGAGGGMKVLATTAGHRVKTMSAGGKTFTGREVREKLELNSSQFTWKITGSTIEITTTGYGHGVGMSQWGANGMAKEGGSAESILKYYYKGVELESASAFIAPST
ncbi:stage II sporulation protein D [Paenibacillus flagellatus]|uniref:Stage II sporulation protein D n=1 Tax=Paenibacillus flagellatus TaxID=2211139 RepID=A0A2V5JWI9_9BACL|nr:stage II sporulation protein D [Paenibacillus flagellatus]PYI51149.1 stage II sporulation protein D [Paenibacillus flagellatus]